MSFYDISTHVDLQLGSIVFQDAYTNETAEVTFDNFEYVNVGVYGSLSVTGSDDWDRLEITGNPLSLDIDMGDGVDTLYLHRLDRFDEEGYFSDDIGITRAEFMDEFDFTLNGYILDVSLVDGDTSVTVATLTSVERVGFKSEDGSGVDRHKIDQLLAEENAVDGVATLNATDGDDDIVALNFTGQSSDIDVFDVNLMDGHDWVEIKLNDGAVTDASITKIYGDAGYDTLHLEEDSRKDNSLLVADFTTGDIQYSDGAGGEFNVEITDVERVSIDIGGDVTITGSSADDDIRIDYLNSLTFIDDNADDKDTLDLYRYHRQDAPRGYTAEEFLEEFTLSQDDDRTIRVTAISDESEVATLKNLEFVRFTLDRDAGTTITHSVAALLSGVLPTEGDDELTGTVDDDNIAGLAENDTIMGLAGDDTLRGGDGDDLIEAGSGDDRVYGDAGNDTIIAVDSGISAHGGAGDDLLDFSGITAEFGGWAEPGLGQDTITGSQTVWDQGEGGALSYADVEDEGGVVLRVGQDGSGTVTSATAGLVNDTFSYMTNFFGSQGSDVFTGSDNSRENGNWEGWNGLGGADTIDGGQGFDELKYNADRWWANTLGAVTVNFATGKATDGFGDEDTFSNIEAVRGTHLGDTFIGSDDQSYIRYRGLAGDDTVTGAAGTYDILDHRRDRNERDADENYSGNNGIIADFINGTVIDGFGDTDSVSSIDEIRGTIFGDHITAGDDGLVMKGYKGDDTLIGGAGDDDFYVGDGTSSVDGADGDDWLYLNRDIADVRVNGVDITDYDAVSDAVFTRDDVLTVTSTDGNLSVTAEGIEALVFEDTFVDLDVLLSGATSAADQVGDATSTVSQDLSAGDGDDTVLGGQADDDLNGGEGNDDIDAGAGDDFVFDNTGDTTLEGGEGDDIVVAIGGNGNFTDTGEVTVVANEVNDFFCGGVWDDWFDAGSGNDILVGDIGSDRHYGNDTLNGGGDNDLLQGGWGQDVFIFGNNDGEDTIARIDLDNIDFDNIGNVPLTGPDFQSGVDKIHLESAGFADLDGDSALALAGVSDVTVDGVTFAQFDHNGTKINFHGLTLSDLSASDFDFV